MEEPRCELSDLPESQCACRVHAPEEKVARYEGRALQARHSGICPACLLSISPGEFIEMVDGQYIHLECV